MMNSFHHPHKVKRGPMTVYWPTLIGFFLGFGFGVGCALAVMYSIFMGGYRAALVDATLPAPPQRYVQALQKLSEKVR
jgi:hypothetical protein